MLKKHLCTILFVSWVVLITSLSLFSFSGLDTETKVFHIPHIDKITHFVFYLLFVILGFFSYKEKVKKDFLINKTIFILTLVAILYGIVIEGLQYIMAFGRAAEISDVLANTIGAVFGSLLIKKYLSLIRKLK